MPVWTLVCSVSKPLAYPPRGWLFSYRLLSRGKPNLGGLKMLQKNHIETESLWILLRSMARPRRDSSMPRVHNQDEAGRLPVAVWLLMGLPTFSMQGRLAQSSILRKEFIACCKCCVICVVVGCWWPSWALHSSARTHRSPICTAAAMSSTTTLEAGIAAFLLSCSDREDLTLVIVCLTDEGSDLGPHWHSGSSCNQFGCRNPAG